MGSNQSVGYQKIQIQINHPKYQKAYISRTQSQKILISTRNIDKNIYHKWKQQLQNSKLSGTYLFLPLSSKFTAHRTCSDAGQVEMINENYPHLLKNQIYDRAGKRQPFSEEQLWYLLFVLIEAKRQFLQRRINKGNVGDIKPENIFISQNSSLKVGCIYSWPGQQESYSKCVEYQNIQSYLAPEQMKSLSLGVTKTIPKQQSQIFSIGMTMLSAGLLKQNLDLYKFHTKKFNYNLFQERILRWRNSNYSQLLKCIVQLLCDIQPDNRLDIGELHNLLFRQEIHILTKNKFSVTWIPRKLEQKIKRNRIKMKQKFSSNNDKQRSIKSKQVYVEDKYKQTQNISQQEKHTNKVMDESHALTHAILNTIFTPISNGQSYNANFYESIDELYLNQIQDKRQQNYNTNNSMAFKKNYNILGGRQYSHQINNSMMLNNINEDEESFQRSMKQLIVQKPIVVDINRKSNDIQEEMTPSGTPTNTQRAYSSNDPKQDYSLRQVLGRPLGVSTNPRKIIIPETNLNNLSSKQSSPTKYKVRQSRSFDPQAIQSNNINHSHLINKGHNASIITNYIPISSEPNVSSLKYSDQFSKIIAKKKQKSSGSSGKSKYLDNQKDKIPELSKDSSEIRITDLNKQDKNKIKEAVIKVKNNTRLLESQRKEVRFTDTILDRSHQSRFLEISDLNLEGIDGFDHSGVVLVEYKEETQNEVILQSIRVSLRNSQISDITSIRYGGQ